METAAAAIYPSPLVVEQALPNTARTYLAQAMETLHAPDGAALLAASAVDAMLKAKGFTDGTLNTRIKAAAEANILTPAMAEWAHKVRLDANEIRHSDEVSPHRTKEQARELVEFARALGEFLFVLPSRIAAGIEAASQAG